MQTKNNSVPSYIRKYAVVAIVAIVGIVVSIAIFSVASKYEYDRIRLEFDRRAGNALTLLKKDIDRNLEFIYSISTFRFLESIDEKNLIDYFNDIKKYVKNRYSNENYTFPDLIFVGYIPYVKNDERSFYEKIGKAFYSKEFQMTEREPDGNLISAGERDFYLPLYLLTPITPQIKDFLGLDIASDPEYSELTKKIFISDEVIASHRIEISGSDKNNQYGFMLIKSILKKNNQDKKELIGSIIGFFSVSGMTNEVSEVFELGGIDIHIYDNPLGNDKQFLYQSRDGSVSAHPVSESDFEEKLIEGELNFRETIKIADRKWYVMLHPTESYYLSNKHWESYLFLILGLIITGALVLYMITFLGRAAKIETLVADRTSELSKANMDLEEEINKRKIAEISVQKEITKLSAMISEMDEGIVFADAKNTIIEVNEYFCRLLKVNKSDIIGKQIDEFHIGRILDNVSFIIENYRNKLDSHPLTFQKPICNEEVILRVQPIYRDGLYDGILFNVINVTELVKARKGAEEASRAKSEFLANVSHEIRTPMNAVMGMIDIVLSTELKDYQRESLQIAMDASKKLLNIIENILNFSKLEADTLVFIREKFNVIDAIKTSVDIFRSAAKEKGLALSCEIDSDIPEIVIGDSRRFKEVLINLIDNAIKFTREGSVSVSAIKHIIMDDYVQLKIFVSDTGIGIPKDKIEKQFSCFTQGDSSFTKEFGGTGLGLALSEKLVTKMRGSIWLESNADKGITAYITPIFDLPKEVETKKHF